MKSDLRKNIITFIEAMSSETKIGIYQRNTKLLFAIIFLFVSSAPLIYAKSTITINCPHDIKTTQQIKNIPTGFSSIISDSPHYLASVTFYSGKPEEQASLAPDTTSKEKMRWTFSDTDSIYMSCGYNQTNIQIYKALPKATHACTVFYDANVMSALGGIPKKIECE